MFTQQQLVGQESINKIYFVQSDQDKTVLVAIDLVIDTDQRNVSWFDMNKERMMYFDEIQNDGENIRFLRAQSEGGGEYSFQPLTLDIYKTNIAPRLDQAEDFSSIDEMKAAFSRTKENAW